MDELFVFLLIDMRNPDKEVCMCYYDEKKVVGADDMHRLFV